MGEHRDAGNGDFNWDCKMFSVHFVIYSQGSPSDAMMFLTLQISVI